MKAGALRHWLTFQDVEVGLDTDGAMTEEWVPAFETSPRMPCEVVALSGRELVAAQAVQSKVSTRIVTRFRPGFRPTMRAWFQDPDAVDVLGAKVYPGTTIYNIEAVILDPDSRRRFVTLLASSGVNDG